MSEAFRRQLQLPFLLLCDTDHRLITAWDLLNPKERGGIAKPAVFGVDTERRVRFKSVDSITNRVPGMAVVEFVAAGFPGRRAPSRRRLIVPALGNRLTAIRNNFVRADTSRPSADTSP